MVRKVYRFAVCFFSFCIVLIFSACMTQVAVNKNDGSKKHGQNLDQTVERQNGLVSQGKNVQEQSNGEFDVLSKAGDTQQDAKSEEEQEMMEGILDLLEEADAFWDDDDVENTIDTLDRAYALLLAVNGNAEVSRQKDDLRLLISKRIMAVYSAQQSVTRGKAGEIPLQMNEAIEREIRAFQGPEREFFISSYQRSGIYRDVIIKELKMAGIPEEFFWLPLVESGYKINALSKARALGLWQFIPSTGYKFGLTRDEWIDERMDPLKSTQAAIAYLKELHSMFGDWLTVLAAYNCGEGRILRVISSQKVNYFDRFWDLYNLLPRETARYVPRFLATLHIIKDQKKYGFDLPEPAESYFSFQTVKVDKMMKLQDVAARLEVSEESITLLNAELRHKMTPDREYELRIPKDCLDKFIMVSNEIPIAEKPSLAAKASIVRHRVRSGETLSSISRRYGVSVSTIRAHNNMRTNSMLIAGRTLSIPLSGHHRYSRSSSSKSSVDMKVNPSGQYRVQKGDILQIIAKRFNVSVAQIKELNNLQSDKIYVGQLLRIKGSNGSNTKNNDSSEQLAQLKIKDKEVLTTDDIAALSTDKYIVTKGDNLYRIAVKNNIDVVKLKELNNLSDEKIIPGQILIVK